MGTLKIAIFFTVYSAFAITAFSQQTGEFRLGVGWGSSLFSNKEQFEFSVGGNQKIVLNSNNPTVYFTPRFSVGQSYVITQLAGPRTCNFWGQERGTFNNQDILVLVDCGQPPLSIFKIEIIGIESGERFDFADSHGRRSTIPFSTTINLGGFPVGDDYNVTQTGGPRQCRMTNNLGVVPATPIIVKADCSKAGGGNPGNTNPYKVQWDLVSRSSDDKSFGTFNDSFTPVIGGKDADEGRYVAFVSYAAGLGGSTGKFRQIIWRDRKTGETKVISVSSTGEEGNQNSLAPAISADGRSVAFESYASNLTGDGNGARDVFLWRAETNRVERVSEGSEGSEANYQSYEPTISGDGNLVAFTSDATNLIAKDQLGISSTNVYLKDTRSGTIQIISKNKRDGPNKGKGGGGSNPSISEDGSRIAFYNYHPLTQEDKNPLWDIYVWERGNPNLKRISKTEFGTDRDQGTESSSRVVAPSISGDGRFVAFATTANSMVANDSNGLQDVFVVDVGSGKVTRFSVGKDGEEGNGDSPVGQGEKIAISHDGRWVAFSSNAKNLGGKILTKDVLSGRLVKVAEDVESTVGQPAISPNGSFVLFGSNRQLDARFRSTGIFAVFAGAR